MATGSRRSSKLEISFLPFLSVLCALIGVMQLFIVAIMTTRAIEQTERYVATPNNTPQAGRPDVLEEGIDASTHAELSIKLEQLSTVLVQRIRDRDELQHRVSALEDLIEVMKTQLVMPGRTNRPRPLLQPPRVTMVPDFGGDSEYPLKPILVEVSAAGYTVHPQRLVHSPIEASHTQRGDLRLDAPPELAEWLRSVDARKHQEYLVFLIHPSGVGPFDAIRAYLKEHHKELNLGWEPFSREWILANETEM